ncbi:MAG TPA: hypothetical protein VID51_08985 [Solirubrobacterales bacterium]|jgi:hypothetical protein
MFDTEETICAPPDATWAELTDQLLQTDECERWIKLATQFVPVDLRPADEMTEMLRENVSQRHMEFETHAFHNDHLLGFFSIEQRRARIGEGSLQPILMLSSIVRSATTPEGFGRVLVEEVIGRALTESDVKAIVVEPANNRVGQMWQDDYHFQPVDQPEKPGLLYLPVDVEVEREIL